MATNFTVGKRTADDALLPTTNTRPPKRSSQEQELQGLGEVGGWRWSSMFGSLVESAIKKLNIAAGAPDEDDQGQDHTHSPNGVVLSSKTSGTAEDNHDPEESHTPSGGHTPRGPPSSSLPQSRQSFPTTSPEKSRKKSGMPPPASMQPPLTLADLTTSHSDDQRSHVLMPPPKSKRIVNHGSRLGGSLYSDSQPLSSSSPLESNFSTPDATAGPSKPFNPFSSRNTSKVPGRSNFSPNLTSTPNLRSSAPHGQNRDAPISSENGLARRSGSLSSNGSVTRGVRRSSKSPFGGVVKSYEKARAKEHIHAKLHRKHVQEALQKELYQLQLSQGYSQDFSTFKDYLSYRERLEALETQDILSASTSIPFNDIPRTPRSLQRSSSRATANSSFTSSLNSSLNRSSNGLNASEPSFSRQYRSRSRSISSTSSVAPSSISAASSVTARYKGLGPEWGSPLFGLSALTPSDPSSPIWLQQAIQKARDSLDAPRPPRPNISAFEQLRLKDKQRDLEIEQRIKEAMTAKKKKLPNSLPPGHLNTVKAILSNRGFVSKAGKEQVAAGDMSRLNPKQWLNDEIINFYGAMLMERAERAKAEAKSKGVANGVNGHGANGKARAVSESSQTDDSEDEDELPRLGVKEPFPNLHYFNTFFFAKLENPGYEKAKLNKWTKKIDVFSKDMILVPVNLGNAHWTCAAINFRKKRIEYYDSMGSKREKVYRLLRSYLEKEHADKKKKPFDFDGWEDYFSEDTPQQENGCDCGVFTCLFMEALSRGEEVDEFSFEQKNMPYLRQRMVWEIGQARIC